MRRFHVSFLWLGLLLAPSLKLSWTGCTQVSTEAIIGRMRAGTSRKKSEIRGIDTIQAATLLRLRGGNDDLAGGDGGGSSSKNRGRGVQKKKSRRGGLRSKAARIRERKRRQVDRKREIQYPDEPDAKIIAPDPQGDLEDQVMAEVRAKAKFFVPPILKKSTFSGLFETSPQIDLPGHKNLTLEHFRTERKTVDVDGTEFPPSTYRWRDRLVEVTVDKDGNKKAMVDLETKQVLHRFAEKTKVYLNGHDDAYLEDFPLERVPTKTMGLYKWRDRMVRVLTGVTGKVDRIIDDADGNVVFLYEDDDKQGGVYDVDMFDDEMFQYDRPAALARASHRAEVMSGDGPLYGQVRIVWPQMTLEGMHHGGTVIWLHEMGSDASESEVAVAKLRMPWVKFILPTAPIQAVSVLNRSVTTSWFDVFKIGQKSAKEDLSGLERSTEYVSRLVEDEILLGTSPTKIALVGMGQGGCVATNAAMRGYRWKDLSEGSDGGDGQIVRVAALAALSSWIPKSLLDLRPFWYKDMLPTYWGGKVVGKRGGLPTLMCHGKSDNFVPFELGRRSYKRAEKIGLDVELKRYDGMGHGMCRTEMHDLAHFLGRHYLQDPVLRLHEILGPEVMTAEGVRMQLVEAGLDPDMVNDQGWLKPEYGGLPASSTRLEVDPNDVSGGVVSVFGHN